MAAVDVGARNVPPVPADDLDDLFDYEVNNEIFRDVDTNMDVPAKQATSTKLKTAERDNAGALGIDEEIKVAKKRTPIAKLDDTRLLAPAGIPKLRRIAKERLKFKGKGHEYADVAKLLNTYQLWLDDLYPRAKFQDGLAIIEKLGHSKRMQTMRKEWINESKARDTSGNEQNDLPISERGTKPSDGGRSPQNTVTSAHKEQPPFPEHDWDREDLYSAAPQENGAAETSQRHATTTETLFVSDNEEEDDLDALMAEDEAKKASKSGVSKGAIIDNGSRIDENFDDEIEAMADFNDMW